MKKTVFTMSVLMALGLSGHATADDYPSKAVELVVPAGAGGGTDLSARIFAKYAQKILKKPVVIVNVGGAGGYNGSRMVYEGKSDGYKIIYTHQGIITSYLTKVAPYSYDGFKPGPTIVMDGTVGLYVSGDSEIKDIKDLIAKAKTNPGKLKAATEYGAFTYFMFNKLAIETGAKFNLVDVGGGAAKTSALLGGYVDVIPKLYVGTQQYLDSGDFRLLGEPTEVRAENAPNIPTYKEQGVDFTFPAYQFAVFFNKNTPDSIVEKWDEVARQVTSNPEYKKDIAKVGFVATFMNSQGTAASYGTTQKEFSELVKVGEQVKTEK
ncbi:tripartite tricarboxylate transporter substrate binding protein [Kangiella sp.]|uniref:tripartite tricarboxylate transporter substrate binding protein n=1 Tax=Kangiella sp. TaxID=1920245 RepID=UPI003A92846A